MNEMVVAHALDRTTVFQERPFTAWRTVVPPGSPASEALPGPDVVISLLRAGGLLRADELGVMLLPKWVAEALARRKIAQLVNEQAIHTLGALAGDASRQFLVDDALDSLASNELRHAGRARGA